MRTHTCFAAKTLDVSILPLPTGSPGIGCSPLISSPSQLQLLSFCCSSAHILQASNSEDKSLQELGLASLEDALLQDKPLVEKNPSKTKKCISPQRAASHKPSKHIVVLPQPDFDDTEPANPCNACHKSRIYWHMYFICIGYSSVIQLRSHDRPSMLV